MNPLITDYPLSTQPTPVMLAARFVRRKRLDLAIKAIVAFHEICPDVNLDIYGQGMLWQDIEAEIANLGAQDYIQLKGHQTIKNRFKEYELYLATSEWETFGITLLEAIGSGQALVGLDVPYGNQTFIQEGKNGYLVPFAARSDEEIVVDLTKALEKAFKQIEQFREGSYRLAEEYLSDTFRCDSFSHLKVPVLCPEIGRHWLHSWVGHKALHTCVARCRNRL